MELEAQLARQPVVYLVLNIGRGVLEVRSRGMVLDSLPVTDVAVVRPKRLLSGSSSHPLELPVVWQVVEGPRDTERELIAPETLRPAPSGEEDVEDFDWESGPSPTPTPIPSPPKSYRARLDNDWDLWIADRPPLSRGPWRFFVASIDGLARLRGRSEPPPPAYLVTMSRSDAQRLYHLIRSGMTILVTTEYP